MPYEFTARSAPKTCEKMTMIQPAETSPRKNRKVAAEGRSAGYAGAVIGTKKKIGDAMMVGDCVIHAKAPLVAARKTSAGPGSGVPREAMKRSTASVATSTL